MQQTTDKLPFLFVPETRIWHFIQIVSLGVNCQTLFSGKNKKHISKCRLLEVLPSMPTVKDILLWSQTRSSIIRSFAHDINWKSV